MTDEQIDRLLALLTDEHMTDAEAGETGALLADVIETLRPRLVCQHRVRTYMGGAYFCSQCGTVVR